MSDEEEEVKSFSIAVTVQRTKVEYGFVSVLVTADLMEEEGKLDTDKLMSCAVAAAHKPEMKWYAEHESIDINPIQKPVEDEAVLSVDTLGDNLEDSDQLDDVIKIDVEPLH